VFDFWQAVGPVTPARGFLPGGIIQNGRTNPTGAIAGGICSTSTTLFNAAVRGGFQILERSPHYYYITRYPLGLDATVSKSGGVSTQNMRFRNDTGVPIYIRGTAGSGWVRFDIYSLPTGRTVTFSKPSVSNVRRAVDRVIRTSELRSGTSRRDEYPANGMDVVVIRTVRDSRGAVIHQDRFVSHYKRVDGILLIGTG
jgi:vancomycin resistance protein YoaR